MAAQMEVFMGQDIVTIRERVNIWLLDNKESITVHSQQTLIDGAEYITIIMYETD